MLEQEDILRTYYDGVSQRIRIEIELLNKLIGHKGEIGIANENLLINLLVKFLPKRYSIGSGVIIDREGNRSNQIDIVVCDSYYHPELFSYGSAVLYPVDVVYMTIEVKTTVNKDTIEEAIKNVASVKRLRFIESPIFELKGNTYTESKTSPPIGIIFGFNSKTTSFNTFENWITKTKTPKSEIFDLCYILNSTFSYTFQDLDHKDISTQTIYLYERAVKKTYNGYENIESGNSAEDEDRRRFPVVSFQDKDRIVDPAIGFVNFLSNIYDMLSLKRITESSVLRHYITDRMLHESKIKRY
jgi:hypothetical protein